MLAIVPARGGSRGIPNKNLRVVAGKPLLLHICDTLRATSEVNRIVVSTEDPEIASVAKLHGYEVWDRPRHLAQDDTPLQAVVDYHNPKGVFGVFQPTTPLTSEQVSLGYWLFATSTSDSLGYVTPASHLLWDAHGPLYQERANRQQLEGIYREVGAFLTRTGQLVTPNHYRYVVDAVDIDTHADLRHAERLLDPKRVDFYVAYNDAVGSGHLRRALTLAGELSEHRIGIHTRGVPGWASTIIGRHGWWPNIDESPDLVVFDKLDTNVDEVAKFRAGGVPVVTLEDTGPGSDYADVVVNELLDDPRPRVVSGPRWAVLRPEFIGLPPFEVRENADRVLVTFGGTDPAGLTGRAAPLVAREACCRVVAPPGVAPYLPGVFAGHRVELVTGGMAEEMRAVDLVVTSAGRTAHEAAACGVPVVTIAANERESRHSHCPGVLRLGLHATVSDDQIQETVKRLLAAPDLRREMSLTARRAVDGLGARRIARKIDDLLEGL